MENKSRLISARESIELNLTFSKNKGMKIKDNCMDESPVYNKPKWYIDETENQKISKNYNN